MNNKELAKIGKQLRNIHSTLTDIAVPGLGHEIEFADALWELDGIIDELGEE